MRIWNSDLKNLQSVVDHREARHLQMMALELEDHHIEIVLQNPKFQYFELQYSNMNDFKIGKLSEFLKRDGGLIALNLSSCCIDDPRLCFLAEAISVNFSLCDLNLSGNNFTEKGLLVFANALKRNKGLRTCDLSWNKIDDEGAENLATCLEDTCLETLYLRMNYIRCRGAKILVEKYEKNLCLRMECVSPMPFNLGFVGGISNRYMTILSRNIKHKKNAKNKMLVLAQVLSSMDIASSLFRNILFT
jgi:hypothetical protein